MPTSQSVRAFFAVAALLPALYPAVSRAQAGVASATTDSAATASTATTTAPDTSAAPAKKRKRLIPQLGPNASYYYFTDSKTRSRFGSSVQGIGLGLGGIRPTLKGKLGVDFDLLYGNETQNGQKNRYFVVGLGPEYRRGMAGGTQNGKEPLNLPYYGVSLNVLYGQVKSQQDNIDGSSLGAGGSVLCGVAFGTRGYVEGRYRLMSKTRGFAFSGAGISVGLRF